MQSTSATGCTFTFDIDSDGEVFFVVFENTEAVTSAANGPLFNASEIREVARGDAASLSIVDGGDASVVQPLAFGARLVSSNTIGNVTVASAKLASDKHYVIVLVAHDVPGGPAGPNLQTSVSTMTFRTLGLRPSTYQLSLVEGTQPLDAESYVVDVFETGQTGSSSVNKKAVVELGDCVQFRVSVARGGEGQLMLASNRSADNASFSLDSLSVGPVCGQSSISVYVLPVDDAKVEGRHYARLEHEVTQSSGRLKDITLSSRISAMIDDNEKGTIIGAISDSVLNEGASTTLSLRLSDAPPNNYTVTVSLEAVGPGSDLTAFTPSSIQFSGTFGSNLAWNIERRIHVTFNRDGGYAFGQRSVSIVATGKSISSVYKDVRTPLPPVTVIDAETEGFEIAQSNVTLMEGGSTSTFSIRMTSRPLATVTLMVGVDSPRAGIISDTLFVEPLRLAFGSDETSWKEFQTVTVRYNNDARVTGAMTRYLTLTASSQDSLYNGMTRLNSVVIVIQDVTEASISILPSPLVITEGSQNLYTARLASQPFNDVHIYPFQSPNGRLLDLSKSSIVVSNLTWTDGTSQRVDVPRDFTQTGDQTVDITHSAVSVDQAYNGSRLKTAVPTVSVRIIDVDVASVVVSAYSLSQPSRIIAESFEGNATNRRKFVVEEGGESIFLSIALATAPLADVTVDVAEVTVDGASSAVTSLLRLNQSATGVDGDGYAKSHVFRKGELPSRAMPMLVNVSVPNNDRQDGIQYSTLRVRVSNSAGDQFFRKLAPILISVTVRDDETAAVTKLIDPNATTPETVEDNGVVVSIPPGALSSSVTLSLKQLPSTKLNAPPATNLYTPQTLPVEFGPSTSFETPILITLPLDSGDFCLQKRSSCQFLYRKSNNASAGDWRIEPGAAFSPVYDASGSASAKALLNVSHFSLYTVAVIKPSVRITTNASHPESTSPTVATFTEKGSAAVIAPNLFGITTSSVPAPVMTLIGVAAEIWKEDYDPGQDFLASLHAANCTSTCTIASGNIPGVTFSLSVRWSKVDGMLSFEPVTAGVTMTPQQGADTLSTVVYSNPSRNPDTKRRRVIFHLDEAYSSFSSVAGDHLIDVVPVNDEPEIALQDGFVDYVEGASPAKIDVGLVISDVDSTQISSAVVWLEPEGVSGDQLSVSTSLLDESAVKVTSIGCCRLQLYTVADIAAYQSALRGVEYHSSNKNPSLLNRTVRYSVTDADSTTDSSRPLHAIAEKSVRITPVNDPPVMSDLLQDGYAALELRATEDAGAVSDVFLRASDVDSPFVSYAISCQASKGTVRLLNASTGEMTYTPMPNANGADSFFAVATDDSGRQSSVREYHIKIEPVPDLPSAASMSFDVW